LRHDCHGCRPTFDADPPNFASVAAAVFAAAAPTPSIAESALIFVPVRTIETVLLAMLVRRASLWVRDR
jgi:hypothetical protein